MIQNYLFGRLEKEEIEELSSALLRDTELRQEYAAAASVDAILRQASIEHSIQEFHTQNPRADIGESGRQSRAWLTAAVFALAAALLVAFVAWRSLPRTVAKIVSSEDAAWESILPTSPGSKLSPGVLHLKSGIATIEFHSGAEMIVEAPARLELISDMRARLYNGAAVMEVPPSAEGFILETPKGLVIDYGTRFAVDVDSTKSNFELIEGEIELHHAMSGRKLRLDQVGTAAFLTADSLGLVEDRLLNDPETRSQGNGIRLVRVMTDGRCGSAIRNESRRDKTIRPEYLYAKHTGGKWEIRSFFEFDLSERRRDAIQSVSLRLNQVPSYRGSASLLPKVNRFAIYGLTNPEKRNWKIESTWAESPAPEDGILLGRFEIPRSQQRGAIRVSTTELFDFVKDHENLPMTFILVRETNRTAGAGSSMTHMFASDKHPEAVGPLLELTVTD
ncbi:MAG: FecR domain-containing protein [Planctomycetota bacterium]